MTYRFRDAILQYSRITLNQSNIDFKKYLDTFKHKQGPTNLKILKFLFNESPLTYVSIANKLTLEESKPGETRQEFYYRQKRMLSKAYRRCLNLKEKSLLETNDSEPDRTLYKLTFKGFITLGLVEPSLREDILLDDRFQKFRAVQREDLGFKTTEQLFLTKKEQEDYIEFFNQIKFLLREFYWILLEPHIQNGRINLDIIKNEDLSSWYEDELNTLFFAPRKLQMYQTPIRDLILKEMTESSNGEKVLYKHRKILQKLMEETAKFYKRQAISFNKT